ncbi:MAG: polyprenyl synthetase family protein [Spirochaetes bacterium]|jgi:geranylgeranyl pyrophosphate synthase|nr:polyprenyl synthetase family protein [Spirochaetota bacterium]
MENDIREILKPVDGYIQKVEESIRRKISSGIPLIDEGALHLFKRGGKRIRAALVVLAGGIKGRPPDDIIDIASACEIVHAASLVHDDIIDQSILRRGDLTVSRKWGEKIAVLIGDYMYTLALNIAVNDSHSALFKIMVEGAKDMVMGELCQLQYSNIESINRKRYYEIIELKTARFMAVCAKMGAVKSDLSPDECTSLYNFGLNTGFAFQIVDDTLDLVENSDTIGKDTGNDFRDGKITLPFLFLMERDSGFHNLLRKFVSDPDPGRWDEIRLLLKDSGAIEESMDEAKKFVDKAVCMLEPFPDTENKKILMELADFFIVRNY